MISETAHKFIPVAPAKTVIVREKKMENCMSDGASQKIQKLADPSKIVRDYLLAVETRDLKRAQAHLASNFSMTYPGGITMQSIDELITWSTPRYNSVKKSFISIDAFGTFVYCVGTLSGNWPNGEKFDGVRFIDRFELSGSKIIRQDVWNDLSEVQRK